MRIANAVLMTLIAIAYFSDRAASETPELGLTHGEEPSPVLEIRGINQESTFGCRRNVPISVAEFEVLNHSQEPRTLQILELERLVARCPDDQPDCTVGDLWSEANPQRAESSSETILWISLKHDPEDGSSSHPVDEPIEALPGTTFLTLGFEPWFPAHIPHWLRGKFRVNDQEIQALEEAFGREIFCP